MTPPTDEAREREPFYDSDGIPIPDSRFAAITWTDHLRYHREEPCDCEPPADDFEELTRLARENGLSISVSRSEADR